MLPSILLHRYEPMVFLGEKNRSQEVVFWVSRLPEPPDEDKVDEQRRTSYNTKQKSLIQDVAQLQEQLSHVREVMQH